MRIQLIKKYFTKAERVFGRRLQEKRIPFKAKVKVNGREIDFIVGVCAIDIDGHVQDGIKNEMLVRAGYIPVHYYNSEVNRINTNQIKKSCLLISPME